MASPFATIADLIEDALSKHAVDPAKIQAILDGVTAISQAQTQIAADIAAIKVFLEISPAPPISPEDQAVLDAATAQDAKTAQELSDLVDQAGMISVQPPQ